MKKLILATALTIICINFQAQINQGRVMLSGSFNYNSNSENRKYVNSFTENETKFLNYGSRVNYGVLITDHIMIGIFGSYAGNKYENTMYNMHKSSETQKDQAYGGGLFARYYQRIGESKFYVFGQLSSGYDAIKGEIKSESTAPFGPSNIQTSKGSGFSVYINPGLVYFVNKTLAIESSFGSFGYWSSKSKSYNGGNYTGELKNLRYGFSLLNGLSLGLNFYFGTVKSPTPEVTK